MPLIAVRRHAWQHLCVHMQIGALSHEDEEHRELFRRNVSTTHMLGLSSEWGLGQAGAWLSCSPKRVRRTHAINV